MHEVANAVARRQLNKAEPVAMGMKPGRFRIDRHRLTEPNARRKIALVQFDVNTGRRQWLLTQAGRPVRFFARTAVGDGAQEKTRTSTASRPQVPETCASTNSATWAMAFCWSLRDSGTKVHAPLSTPISRAARAVVDAEHQLG